MKSLLIFPGRTRRPRAVCSSRPESLTRGRIAIEIEAAEIDFRKVEIKSLSDEPGPGK